MSIFDNNIFGSDFGPTPTQQLQPQVPALTPDEEESILSKLSGTALHGLGWLGGVMDKAGRPVRAGVSMLMGRDTPASELLSFLPFSDTLGITDPGSSVSGAELLGGNKDTELLSPHGVGGMLAEIALDPTTYLSFGAGALTKLGQTAAKAGIKLPSAAARAAGVTGDLAQQLARHANVPVAEVAGKSLGGHIGVGLPFMGNSMTFDLTRPLAAAGAAFDRVPGSSLARAAVNKADELTKPLRTGFSSMFEGATRGQTIEELQQSARAATGRTTEAIYENLGHMVPIVEELQRLAGHVPGEIVSPQVRENANRLGQQLRLAMERTPTPLDDATKAILANTPPNVLQAAQAGFGPVAPEILDAVAKAKHFDDVTKLHEPLLKTVDPRIVELAKKGRQIMTDQLAAERAAGYMTEDVHRALADPFYDPRYSIQGETGHIAGGGKGVQLTPEAIRARDDLLRDLYTEGPGSINWFTGTPEGAAIAKMPLQDAKQEVLKKMLGWTTKEVDDFVDLSNRNFAAMSPADEARFTELFAKTQPVATTAPATDELFHILSYKDPSKSVPEAINVLQGGSMRPIDTWSHSAQHGPAAQRWNANAATNTVSLVYDRPALEAAGQQIGRLPTDTVKDRLGIAKVYNPNAPKYDPALTKVVFKGDQASLEFAAVQKAVDDLNLKRQSFGLQPVELATPYQAMQPKVTMTPAAPLGNLEANEFAALSKKKSGPGLTADESLRLKELGKVQEKAEGLVNWQRKQDLDALQKTGGFFGNNPMADWQRYLEKRAANRVNAEEVFKVIPKLMTLTPGPDAVPVMEVMKKLGLNYEMLDPAVRGGYLPEKAAEGITNFIRPATVQEGTKPWLNLIDSITNLTKAGQTSWPATQMRNIISDIYNRFAYGGSPIKPLFDAKAFREGQTIPGAAQRLGIQGLDDAAATKMLQQEAFRLNLLDTKKFQAMEAAGIDPLKQTIQRGMPFIGAPMPGLGETLKGHIPRRLEQINPLEVRGVGGRQESKFFPVGLAQSAQNYAEETNRLGTYIDARMRGYSPIAAFDQVTKAHLDFSNLAPFEKNVMRRAVPFYSWSRQNLPAMVREITTNPGGRMAQTMRLFNSATDMGFMPEQISQTGYAIPVGAADEQGRRNYLTSLGLPFEDLANLTSGNNLLGSTTPFFRVPYELTTGRQVYTGQNIPAAYPFEGSPTLNTLAMNSPLSRIFTTYRTLGRGVDTGNYFPAATQFLAGPRITNVDPSAARRSAVRQLADQRLGTQPEFSRFERLSVRPGQLANLTPEELQLLQLYNSVNRRQTAPR